ncbi:IclR family transcriptional regulator [Flexivirga endophytica]|uniref:IclR family transcriptional regulator n=1 Tax=Flexivirga endophytica TaxID=1849103 RepID=A0A916SW34_9MICO|nr:IclR family transcriptional regulator [Flexivirga endophytica]GGB19284.1 IclR family transcriptional regulator [Flexivirga endophytica]GHB36412.1 IclR family transcriptional regulator [Flexivirga endophytica]
MSQSLARALQILAELDAGGRSLDELARSLEVHKTTVLRLLRTLEDDRFVRRDDNHRYFLGSRLFELGTSSLEQHTIRDIALPHLENLGRQTGGQAIHLAAYESGRAIYIAKVESTSSVRMYSRVGLIAPVHATAVGKVLTCELPERQLAIALAATDFRPFTRRTITTQDAFRAELATVREQGWAEDSAEHEDFINCVGAPIRDSAGRIIAAASISVPDVILDRDGVHDLLPSLQQTTAAIAADWASTTERT